MAAPSFTISWIEYQARKEEIINLRKIIFCDELKRDQETLTTPWDDHGLHLAIFRGDEMIAISSSYIITDYDPMMKQIPLKPIEKGEVCVQTTKRGSLQEYRAMGINEIKEIITGAQIIDVFNPAYFFATLHDDKLELKLDYYKRKFGFNYYSEAVHDGTRMTIVISEGKSAYDFVLGNYDSLAVPRLKEMNIPLPSLADHLAGRKDLKEMLRKTRINPKYSHLISA